MYLKRRPNVREASPVDIVLITQAEVKRPDSEDAMMSSVFGVKSTKDTQWSTCHVRGISHTLQAQKALESFDH